MTPQPCDSRIKLEHTLADAQPFCGARCEVRFELLSCHGIDLRARKKAVRLLDDLFDDAKLVTNSTLLYEQFGNLHFWTFSGISQHAGEMTRAQAPLARCSFKLSTQSPGSLIVSRHLAVLDACSHVTYASIRNHHLKLSKTPTDVP